MTREFGRAPRGERLEDRVPRNRGDVITMIGALTTEGLTAMMTIEGGTSGDVFATYVERVLLPELSAGDFVVLDNLGAHRDQRTRELIESVGAKLIFLPPYSPDLNPIEYAWSKVKSLLKLAKARSHEALDEAFGYVLNIVTSKDAQGWIGHCGYRAQAT
jgi:transposase